MSYIFKVLGYQLRPTEGASAASSSGARTIDFSLASAYTHAITEGTTFTLSGCVVGGAYILRITNASGSARSVAFAGTVIYLNATGAAPANIPDGKTLLVSIYCHTGTTTFDIGFNGNYAA